MTWVDAKNFYDGEITQKKNTPSLNDYKKKKVISVGLLAISFVTMVTTLGESLFLEGVIASSVIEHNLYTVITILNTTNTE